jgi:DNA repair exonuclease SbcCD nuclease subunit
MSLFERAIVFTDIHHGNKSNSQLFNQDCSDFVDWICETAKQRNINTCLFLGDWNHNRASINVATLNYSTENLDKLNQSFDAVHFIPGNHDEYYRDKRDYNSIPFVHTFSNIHFYNDITTVDGATFVPWLVGDEYKKMRKLNSDNYSLSIQDGQKVIVCKLKSNVLNMTSVAYPTDEAHLPEWFKELPFDEATMRDTIVDQKVDNLLGVLNWDLKNATSVDDSSFNSLFSFG